MMPFSPEFLREIKNQTGPDTSSKKDSLAGLRRTSSNTSISSKQADTNPNTLVEGHDRLFHAYRLSEFCTIVGCEDESFSLFISGFCRVVALKGEVSVNGYTVPVGDERFRIYNPIWQPAYPVCNGAGAAIGDQSSFKTPNKQANPSRSYHIEKYLKEYNISFSSGMVSTGKFKGPDKTSNLFGEFNVVFAVEGMEHSQQEWLVAAEDQSMFKDVIPATVVKPDNRGIIMVHTSPTMSLKKTSLVRVGSAMLGNYSAMSSAKADCMTITPSWITASDKLASHHSGGKSVSVAICGAKGVGKSTCLRYVVNKLLSISGGGQGGGGPKPTRSSVGGAGAFSNKKPATAEVHKQQRCTGPSVCVIDCDLGQPELSVPGSVSLHVVSCSEDVSGDIVGPFLSASHLNMQTPDRSYFLGDLTSKHEPQLVLQYIQLLLQRYKEIVAEVAVTQEQARKTATKKFVGANAFNALLLDADSASETESEDEAENQRRKSTGAVSSTAANTRALLIPLVINLDGYVKNMGAEVLENILRMADPTHVIHLCSDRDRSLLPLESILGLPSAVQDGSDAAEVHPATKSPGPSAAAAGGAETAPEKQCEVLVLEPGRYYTTPRLAAVDLRSLRLVAYFLRSDTGVRSFVRDVSLGASSSSGNLVRSGSSGNIQQRNGSTGNLSALGENATAQGDGVTLRNGSVGHPLGVLALRLLSLAPYSIPFSCVSLCSIPCCGDLPARLVLASMNASVVGIIVNRTKDESSQTLSALRQSGKKRLRLAHNEFEISCPSNYPVAHCVGLGIIRAVDLENKRILLTTPVDDSLLLGNQIELFLVKGAGLQLPASLTYAPNFPCFPFLSSESTGEGSAQLRTRNNVKRRAQHQ